VVANNVTANVTLLSPVRVSGTVTINGGYIAGLKVKVMNGAQVVGVYSVNPDNTYRSGPLAPGGTYTAYAVYGSLTSSLLTSGGTDAWGPSLYTISGTVSGLASGTATITASSANGQMMKTATSNVADGTYTIANLVPANDYIVSAVLPVCR
jgi:hypothetical protein